MTNLVQITRMTRSEFVAEAKPSGRQKWSALFPPQLEVRRLSKRIAESVTVEPGTTVPDCLTCGVCCAHYWKVPMSRDESERLGAYIEITDDSETDVVVDRLVPRNFELGACSFLTGELGQEIACSGYERRPQCCHDFEAGSDRCREVRRIYGLEPQLSEAEVSRFAFVGDQVQSTVIIRAACLVDRVSISIETSSESDGAVVSKKTVMMKILVSLNEDLNLENWIEIHSYESDREFWLQSEFIGMTIEDAKKMILREERTLGSY